MNGRFLIGVLSGAVLVSGAFVAGSMMFPVDPDMSPVEVANTPEAPQPAAEPEVEAVVEAGPVVAAEPELEPEPEPAPDATPEVAEAPAVTPAPVAAVEAPVAEDAPAEEAEGLQPADDAVADATASATEDAPSANAATAAADAAGDAAPAAALAPAPASEPAPVVTEAPPAVEPPTAPVPTEPAVEAAPDGPAVADVATPPETPAALDPPAVEAAEVPVASTGPAPAEDAAVAAEPTEAPAEVAEVPIVSTGPAPAEDAALAAEPTEAPAITLAEAAPDAMPATAPEPAPEPAPQPAPEPAPVAEPASEPATDAAPVPAPAPAEVAPEAAPAEVPAAEAPASEPSAIDPPVAAAPAKPLPQADGMVPAAEEPALPDVAPDRPEVGLLPETEGLESSDSTFEPAPGLGEADGVVVGRLPRIGDAPVEDAPADGIVAADPVAEPDTRPIVQFATEFENPEAKPLLALVLIDPGTAELDRAGLAALPFPVSFALDPQDPATAERAAIYRAAGKEVLMLATGIAEGAQASDIEVAFQSMAQGLPDAVAVMDLAEPLFQDQRPLASLVVPVVGAQGRGLLTWDRGLNAADQVARRDDVPAAVVFRDLDTAGPDNAAIRRVLDRAVFKAGQDGRVAVAGTATPELVAALLEWSVEGRAATVALAPITAVLTVE